MNIAHMIISICPGRHFADASLFINIASVLHVFEIGPPLDESGGPIAVEPRMVNSFVSYVKCPFPLRRRFADFDAGGPRTADALSRHGLRRQKR